MLSPLSHLLPPLPGFTALSRTYAPWPVWSDSTTTPIRFAPMPKKAVIKLWHRARDFDRTTHEPGRHGCLLYTSPSPRDYAASRMPSSA